MKYGGNAMGVTTDGKKRSTTTKDSTMVNAVNGEDRGGGGNGMEQDIQMAGDTHADVDMSLYDDEVEKLEDKGGSEKLQGSGNKVAANYEVMEMNASVETIVQRWEIEVERWEKEVTGAATAEFKTMAEKNLHQAQLMLKESLLRMTTADNAKREDIDDNSDSMGEEEGDEKEVHEEEVIMVDDEENTGNTDETHMKKKDTVGYNGHDKEDWIQKNQMGKTEKRRVTAIENWGDVSDDENWLFRIIRKSSGKRCRIRNSAGKIKRTKLMVIMATAPKKIQKNQYTAK